VTGETCSCFSEHKQLGRRSCSAFLFRGWGCVYLGLQIKAIKPPLTLLTSSSHRLFIIRSPQVFTVLHPFEVPDIFHNLKKSETGAEEP
jgi:hypothetical protein